LQRERNILVAAKIGVGKSGKSGSECEFPDWTVSYQYDAFGRRIGLLTNGVARTFLWSGSSLLTEYVNGTIDRDYVNGTGYAPLAVDNAENRGRSKPTPI